MKSNKAVVKMMEPQTGDESIAPLVEEMLGRLGEDPKRDGLARTPERVDKALRFLTSGYRMNTEQILNGALYEGKYDEMVVGLSKMRRIVDMFARRLQIQERLTQQVAQTVQEAIKPLGVGVICEARHFCMMMRGVEKQHSGAMTSAMLGAFRDRKETRDEFLALVNHRTNGY